MNFKNIFFFLISITCLSSQIMEESMTKIPRIGVGVLIIRNNKILLGKRLNSHGDGTWAPPGGHLEFGEIPEQCAARETLEETGLKVSNIQSGPWTNDIFEKEGKHYLTLFMLAHSAEGEPQILEPHKCAQWEWFSLDNLPQPLFLPLQNFLNDKTKTNFIKSYLQ